MKITAKFTLIFIILFGCTYEALAQFEQYNHPELKWLTFETDHFVVHYHDKDHKTPFIIAQIAEEIYGPVTRAYKFEPDAKIHFIVRDHDDYANGITFYYDNKIEIWATPLDFLLRGTSSWLRNVITHEFTHMIQLQASKKMPRKIPSIYFQSLEYEDERRPDVLYGFPNRVISYPVAGIVMPNWYAEGTAQYETLKLGYESWDSHREMILRTRTLNNELYSLTEMGVFGKTSIGNESVYNQGFSFVSYIAREFGDETLERITKLMGGVFSIRIEQAIKKAVGIDGKELYNRWKRELDDKYASQAAQVNKNLQQGQIIDVRGSANVFPVWIGSGSRIAYLSNDRSDYISATSLFMQDINKDNRKRLDIKVDSPPSYNEKTNKIVYSKLRKNENHSHFYDLYLYDLNTEKENCITKSMRATYPSLSPDGSTIYFVKGNDGTSNLYSYDIESGSEKRLTNFSEGEELFMSTISPLGREIVFSIGSRFGRDIAVMNTDGSGFRYMLDGLEDERNPSFSPDGSRLYYSSDRTGIYNIYEYDLDSKTEKAVTNVIGGAFMPSVNTLGQLIYTLYTSEGYKLALIDNIRYTGIENNLIEEYRGQKSDKDIRISDIPQYESKPYEYKSINLFFIPRIVIDYGKPKLGLYTYGGDALDKYTFFAGAAFNKDKDRDLFALFDYKKFRQTIFIELYNLTRHTSFFEIPNYSYNVDLGFWEADLGIRQKLTEEQEYQVKAVYGRQWANVDVSVPGIVLRPLRYDYYKGLNFNINWRYDNVVSRMDMDINPSYGRRLVLDYWMNYDEIFEDFIVKGSMLDEIYKKYDYHKLVFDYKEYLGTPFILDRSALSLHVEGGFIDRNVDDFLNFFAGGLTGLKAYSFYSIEGRKKLNATLTYRFPVIQDIGFQFGPWYFDKLYASASYQAGNAWNKGSADFNDFKKGIDLGIRMDMFSFYIYPTKVGFNAAYGFDEFETFNRLEGKTWKYFLTILFGYDF
ncbi:DPP IV N-terminal domain-containing protein [candidate division KSB1 bacterium]